jgi:membrane-bound inhibitor of C-type lysozyme
MADEISTQQAPTPSAGGKNKGILIAIIVLIVIFIGGGFILVSKMTSGSSQTTKSSSSNPTDVPATIAPIVEANYTCQDKKTMKITYDNTAHTAKVVLSDGRTLNLTQQESGSGTQYANSDGTIVLSSKGNSALLTENGKQTYEACSSGS